MFLPFKRYAAFSGRSQRPEFWLFCLFLTLVYLVMFAIVGGIAYSVMQANGGGVTGNIMAVANSLGVFGVIILGFWLATLLPWLAVSARRLHDINLSGWWLAIPNGFWFGGNLLRYLSQAMFDPMLLFFSQICAWLWLAAGLASIVLFCLPSTRGANRYGPDPMGPTDVAHVFA